MTAANGTSSLIGRTLSRFAAVALALCSFGPEAALLGRDISGNPVAANDASAVFVYDDHQNLTWLRDWNYAQTSGLDPDGRMNWTTAVNWASTLTVGAFGGWRLPTTDTGPSSNCGSILDPGGGFPQQYFGINCTGSELGHIWYTELGNTAFSLPNTGPFLNLQADAYFSGTGYVPDTTSAWFFNAANGVQGRVDKNIEFYAVAVRPGDVFASSVPEPHTLALSLLGLGAMLVARRRPPR